MTRNEYLQWCKNSNLKYLNPGENYSLEKAFINMISDLKKHEETKEHQGIELGIMLKAGGFMETENEIRDWIEGFN